MSYLLVERGCLTDWSDLAPKCEATQQADDVSGDRGCLNKSSAGRAGTRLSSAAIVDQRGNLLLGVLWILQQSYVVTIFLDLQSMQHTEEQLAHKKTRKLPTIKRALKKVRFLAR